MYSAALRKFILTAIDSVPALQKTLAFFFRNTCMQKKDVLPMPKPNSNHQQKNIESGPPLIHIVIYMYIHIFLHM